MKLNKFTLKVNTIIVGFCLVSAVSVSHANTTLQIDPSSSYFFVAPWYFIGNDNSTEKYPISGTFNLKFDTWYDIVDRIRFEPVNISTPILPRGPFTFPEYPVEFDGINFSGNGDPCNFYSGQGTCYSMGNFGFYSGSFDGENLDMTGAAPIDFDESYFFSIKAEVAATPVPEPTTILLLGFGLVGMAGYGRKKLFKK